MKTSQSFVLLVSLMGLGFGFCSAASVAENACTAQERWQWSSEVELRVKESYLAFLSKKSSPVRAFSEGLALRKWFAKPETKLKGEYLASRSLYEAGLLHLAHRGFEVLVLNPVQSKSVGIQLAALECLMRIEERYPSIPIPQGVGEILPRYLEYYPRHPVILRAAVLLLQHQVSENHSKESIRKTLKIFRNGGEWESLARGLFAAHEQNYAQTVTELEKVSHLHFNQVSILLARAHFNLGQFEKAALNYKKIQKNSNELSKSLSELAWSQLMDGKYADAIGTSLNLESGGLRNTFAPEAPMVMAMALNEICQFPESLKAIRVFKSHYEKSYQWLENWFTNQRPLYELAVQYLRFKGEAPKRVASEWIRSPVFITHQEEINLLNKEESLLHHLSRAGSNEEGKIVQFIREWVPKLKSEIRAERKKLQSWEPLSKRLRSDLLELRVEISRYRHFREASPIWRMLMDRHQKNSPLLIQKREAAINSDLRNRSVKMLRQLEEIAENNQMIEVEIFQGASDDIIWQNAHPDYKEIAKKLRSEESRQAHQKVWDWGQRPSSFEADHEVWEDELGSFKASLFDNCSSKEKYLALRERSQK